MEIENSSSEAKNLRPIKEFRPIYFSVLAISVLTFFFLSIGIIYFTFSSYRDYIIRESIDNYGYEMEPLRKLKREVYGLDNAYWIDKKKGIVNLPLYIAGPMVIEEYKKGQKKKK